MRGACGITSGIQNARVLHESFPIVSHESEFEPQSVALASTGKVHRVGREDWQPPRPARPSP